MSTEKNIQEATSRIRTNKQKIVQFQYGDDGIDTGNIISQEITAIADDETTESHFS